MHAKAVKQETGLPHCPFELHVCICAAEHCVAPGTQTPEQAPSEQTYGQVVPASHRPFELHVSRVSPSHRVCVGPQVPVHAPETHVLLVWHAADDAS